MPDEDKISEDLEENGSGPRILIVEDDRDISDLVARYLEKNGLTILQAYDGTNVDDFVKSNQVDLIVLDVNLPKEDGFSICTRLRRTSRIPIIMLTAKSEDIDTILGLELGADDYMSKPFNPRELLARINAVLRRHAVQDEPAATVLRFLGWTVSLTERRVYDPANVEIALTSTEFDVLVIFCENSGRVLPRTRLLDLLRGQGRHAGGDRSIDIVISRLRRKIEPDPHVPKLIKTVRSGGYIFACAVETV